MIVQISQRTSSFLLCLEIKQKNNYLGFLFFQAKPRKNEEKVRYFRAKITWRKKR